MCAYSCSREGHLWLGLVAFVIGAVILLQRFDIVPTETWGYLWPSILVVSGLKLMIVGGKKESECCGSCEEGMDEMCGSCGGDSCDGTCEMPMPMAKKSMKKKGGKKK